MKYKLKGFTIMELIIAMVVTAILIGVVYTSYLIISKSYLSFQNKNNDLADLNRLNEWLTKDFDRCELIARDTAGFSLLIKGKTVHYQFSPDFITRQAARVDTFKFKSDSLIECFEDKSVEAPSPVPEQNRLDEIDFIIRYKNERIPYYYHKQYSSVNLINRNPNAVN